MDTYEIRVAGHLSRRRARSLGCDTLRLLPGGESVLTFAAVDQAALYGLMARLRDAGLELLTAERLTPPVPQPGSTTAPTPQEVSDVID